MRLFHCCHDGKDGGEACRRPTSRSGRILHFGGHAVLGLVVVVAVAALFGWVVMTAWNAVMPAVFNLASLGFWQAVALLVLGRVLTGRLHHRRHRHGNGHGCCFSGKRAPQPPVADGGSFAQWWWEEGESAFKSYQSRQTASQAASEE